VILSLKEFMKEVPEALSRKDIALNVGCGEGSLGMLLREKYEGRIYLVGVDISEKH